MHEPLKGPSTPSSPRSPLSPKRKISYDHARTNKPEMTERIRNMRTRSSSPIAKGSPNNSSRRSRSVAVDKTIQEARDKVHYNRMNNSSDTMEASDRTVSSTISASAILDRRRPLHQDADGSTIILRSRTSTRISTVDENAIKDILGITSGETLEPAPKTNNNNNDKKMMRNSKKARRANNRKTATSAPPIGRRQSNQRRTPATPSFPNQNGQQYNDIMDSSDEEEDYNDRTPPRPRKPRTSRVSGQASKNVREIQNTKRISGGMNQQTRSLSPSGSGGRIRENRRPRAESVSSLSGSDSDTGRGRRSRMQRKQQMRGGRGGLNTNNINPNQSEQTDEADKSQKSHSLSPHHARKFPNNNNSSNNNMMKMGENSHNNIPFVSPTTTRGTVSPLSSPSHHNNNNPEEISPLTTSTRPSFLNGPIRMHIPWAKEADMGGAKKDTPRNKLLIPNNNNGGQEEDTAEEDGADDEVEDSFEMKAIESSYEFSQLEVDKNPIRPNRLSSIRSLNYRERHLRSSYPHELEMYKGKSPNDPDYMPNLPTRSRASARSSTGSYALTTLSRASSSGTNHSSSLGRSSMFENSYAHELDLYKQPGTEQNHNNDMMSPPSSSMDRTPMRPTRLASMQSLKLHQSSGSFSIGTFDTCKDSEASKRLIVGDRDGGGKADNEEKEVPEEKKTMNNDDDDDEAPAETADEIDSESKASIRSHSPPPRKETKESRFSLRAPHTVGASIKKRTIFLSPLTKINLPKASPGSLRSSITLGWSPKESSNNNGQKRKSWLPTLGKAAGGGSTKQDSSETDSAKRSTRTNSKRLGRMEEVTEEETSPLRDHQSPDSSPLKNQRARSLSPHGVKKAASKKKRSGKAKKKKQQPKSDEDS